MSYGWCLNKFFLFCEVLLWIIFSLKNETAFDYSSDQQFFCLGSQSREVVLFCLASSVNSKEPNLEVVFYFFFVGVSLESMGIQWSGVRPVTQSEKRSLTIFPFIFPCNTDTPNFSIKLCMVSKVSKIFFAAYNVWKMQVYDTPIAEAIFKTWASIYKTGVNGD